MEVEEVDRGDVVGYVVGSIVGIVSDSIRRKETGQDLHRVR